MELRQLAVFAAVAEEGSFTRAADRLRVVQSAVSAGVRNLERELGASLFDRSTHRVQLTDAGEALLPEARATLTAASAARDAVDAVRGGIRGTVLLGTMQAQGMRAIGIPELLAGFRHDHPLVQVHIRHAAGGSTEMATQVKEGQLDLAFVSLPAHKLPGVELTPLTREPMMVLAPATHQLAKRRSLPIAALADEPLAEFPAGWGLRMVSDRAFASAGITRTITYEVNDTASVIEFVRHGLALSLLPASFVGERRGLALIPIRGPVPEFRTAIAAPSNRRLNAAARTLLETIKHTEAADPRRLTGRGASTGSTF